MISPSQNAVNLVKSFEGFRAVPYHDMVGVATIGYGHTGPDVESLAPMTEPQAASLLLSDLQLFASGLGELIKFPLNAYQGDALICLSYNIGLGNFKKSLVLRHINAGDVVGAANYFKYWAKAGGVYVPGLVRRRAAEAALYRGQVPNYLKVDLGLGPMRKPTIREKTLDGFNHLRICFS